jgi:hypothetical protein
VPVPPRLNEGAKVKIIKKLPALLGLDDYTGEVRSDCPVCGYTNTCVIRIEMSEIVGVHCFACNNWDALKDALSNNVGKQFVQLGNPLRRRSRCAARCERCS